MKRTRVYDVLKSKTTIKSLLVKGWIRTRRDSKKISFIEINDGSSLSNLQIVIDHSKFEKQKIKDLSTGTAVSVTGRLVSSPAKGQAWELLPETIEIIGQCPEDYPLQKKRHSDEFLRTIAHLRPRTNKYGALFRIRSEASWLIHDYFHSRGFRYITTPIITGLDCEGAGELFSVLKLTNEKSPETDSIEGFFGKPAYLTVSGQLSAEMLALSIGNVYTFGPTFRAENSNTRRHCAEFWMIEPEIAFCDLEENMRLAESLIKTVTKKVMTTCPEDLEVFYRFVDKDLKERLEKIVSSDFARLSYAEVIKVLKDSNIPFEYPVFYGCDLQSEHERFLTEEYLKKPVFVYDYPKEIKPFYMRLNDDGKTVAAMDLLVPGIGEIVGGSQREERYDKLLFRMEECGLNLDDYWWYLDSRKFGSVPHSGFGMGFERYLMLITGVKNIRDVIPFPRTPGSIDF